MTDRDYTPATTWNYRVIQADDGTLQIHEVYYDNAGKPWAYTAPTNPVGDDLADLTGDLRYMFKALEKPIITQEEAEAW